MNDTVIIAKLKELVRVHGSQREAAKHIPFKDGCISEQYLSMLIKGQQAIPKWLADVFHYRAEWIYYPLRSEKK